jgi:hypothetical protein
MTHLLCFFLQLPDNPFLLHPNILLRTLFSVTFSLFSSLNVRDQISYPYKSVSKKIVLYYCCLYFLGRRWKDRNSDLLVANISQNLSPFNFLMNAILICYCYSQILGLCDNCKAFISYFIQWLRPVVSWQQEHLLHLLLDQLSY